MSKRVFPGLGPSFAGHVKVSGGRIVSVGPGMPDDPGIVLDVGDARIIPGMIDLHIHGFRGNDAMVGDPSGFADMAWHLAREGVTAFQPTSAAAPPAVLDKVVQAVRDFTLGPVRGARSLGLHMEGPFLNPEHKGAMPEEFLMSPDLVLLARWLDLSCGTIRQVTLAPELPGALDAVRRLASAGITVSAGHTGARYEEMLGGFGAGIRLVTHTFNAMRGFHHREPGALGAALVAADVYCELILDLVHVHEAAARVLLAAKGVDRVCLVTDAIAAAGLPAGKYEFLGREVTVDENGRCLLPGGTLAGSTAILRECLRNLAESLEVSFETALRTVTVNPSKVSGTWPRKGSLEIGKDADIVVLDDSFNVLCCMVEGEMLKAP